MPHKKIITGQDVKAEKLERAQEFRRQMTPAEAKLWQHLRAGRLEGLHFRRQQVIDRYIVDFYCHQADLVVEVDSAIHQEQAAYDRERDRRLEERGLRVLRFTNPEVNHNLALVLRAIFDACQNARRYGAERSQGTS